MFLPVSKSIATGMHLTLGQKNLYFIPKIMIWKSHTLQTSHFGNLIFFIFFKIHNLDISFFSKFTFWNLIFDKIHILKISFLTKFAFFKHQILGNFWIKSWFLPQCASKYLTHFDPLWSMLLGKVGKRKEKKKNRWNKEPLNASKLSSNN